MDEKDLRGNQDSATRVLRIADLLQPADLDEFWSVTARLKELRNLVHKHIAYVLEPVLNHELSRRPHNTLTEKQDLTRWANSQMRSLGVAVQCPKTGEPAILRAGVDGGEGGRFQVELIDQSRGRSRTVSSSTLFPIQLMPHPERREPLVEYWAKQVQKNRHEKRNRE